MSDVPEGFRRPTPKEVDQYMARAVQGLTDRLILDLRECSEQMQEFLTGIELVREALGEAES